MLAKLQTWLQGVPVSADNWLPRKRGPVRIWLGNLIADLRYWHWRITK